MKIRKEKSEYYKRRLTKLFTEVPDSKYVRNRYRSMRYLLVEKHAWFGAIPKETALEFLREVIYIDRQIRLETESIEKNTKKILSDQFIQYEIR